MNADMQNSITMMKDFKQKDHKGVISGIELSVKVLRAGVWEYQQNDSLKLPDTMNRCCERFDNFFKAQHSGKNLKWIPSLGDCEVKSLIYSKPYSFTVTTYQTAILMLFNTKEEYTYKELIDLAKLPSEIIYPQLFNLIHPKMGKLLLKEDPKKPKMEPNEKLKVNPSFSFSNIKIVLAPMPKDRVGFTAKC
jgi:hypothetical protein